VRKVIGRVRLNWRATEWLHPPVHQLEVRRTDTARLAFESQLVDAPEDAERHAILSASLASQADRLMVAGLRLLDPPHSSSSGSRPRP
jgi:hypothetical protein